MSKPSLPQGTRDFGATVVRKRNFIFNTIRSVFELYGFQPLETPAMENMETLMGKYGEEGDKLIFKILNNGLDNQDKLEKTKAGFDKIMEGKNSTAITEKALRYDLTIPFARYVAMNHGQLTFPFKRYQVQPVWRADRPQRGRYREFYQCDADVVGSKSLINEVELTNIYSTVFSKLNIPVEIHLNNRKVLAALAEVCGGTDKLVDITIAIDKLDKIGIDKVKEELIQRGLTETQVNQIAAYLNISGSNTERLQQVNALVGNTENGRKGVEELQFIVDYIAAQPGVQPNIVLDFTLARGLNYYTGTIYEIKALNVQMGSIGGGGRYDDLTGLFGVPNLPGVGISFGVDRIYDVMEELQLFPEEVQTGTQVLFFNLGEAESKKAFELMQQLRSNGIRCELFHEQTKFDKQFKYAEKKNIPYAIILGSTELQQQTCVVRNLVSGEQTTIQQTELLQQQF
ncbi:histidine--tRNA ligase [Deminuibacter soli]|uniref:Histidine--tRNA ligase n=1 Tax=Deminuibacter soli TaxID=2291815 RepID=A0A3E1NNX1_9BACT|nr:histidine--tRNA ligase [Deminuibacter soli]RFM29625.1 histidine--tRNA ligase [Deminuibacter soli]